MASPRTCSVRYQCCSGDEGESDLDLEWAGGVAKNASITFVFAGLGSGEDVSVEYHEVQFLYADSENYAFMDTKTYEQFTIPVEGEEEKRDFLKDGENYQVVFWEQTPIDIKLPTKMVFTVSEAERAERGDTVSGATKVITCETGLKVKVPLFIKTGDKILINTETREYQERVNT